MSCRTARMAVRISTTRRQLRTAVSPAGVHASFPASHREPFAQAALTTAVQMSNGTMLRCTRHNFIFRLRDGKGVNCVGLQLKVYDVRETEGRLEVDL